MRSGRRIFTAVLVGAAAVVPSLPSLPSAPVAHADFPVHAAFDPTNRPRGAVTVIGDSVLDGSMINGPTIVDRLAERGWGPIRAQTRGGYSTGRFDVALDYQVSYWIERWRAEGWDAPTVLVNLGANDSGFCGGDVDCAEEAILHLVDVIGSDRTIWWPKITRFPYHQRTQDAWNAALDRVAASRPYFFTWDWPTVMANGPFPSADRIHLAPDGYRLRSVLMADEFTADLTARRTGTSAALPMAIGAPAEYLPLTPERIVDTREDPPGRLAAGRVLTVDLAPHVPDGTTAVAVNLTTTGTTEPGFLTAHPCGSERPQVSSVNHAAGASRGALAMVPLSADGTLCVFTRAAGHVVVDLQGAFVNGLSSAAGDGLRFTPLTNPRRLLDTRLTGRSRTIEIRVPRAAAVAVNLTATGALAPGWVRVDGCGDTTTVSNVNAVPGEAVAGAAVVPVSPDGTICITTRASVDVVVDITGTFALDGALRFRPVVPRRMLDVRDGTGGWSSLHGARQTIDTRVAPIGASAVTGTLTLVRPVAPGWARVDACGAPPPTSNVNSRPGVAMANSVTVAVSSNGRLCVTSSVLGVTVFDLTGWWVS